MNVRLLDTLEYSGAMNTTLKKKQEGGIEPINHSCVYENMPITELGNHSKDIILQQWDEDETFLMIFKHCAYTTRCIYLFLPSTPNDWISSQDCSFLYNLQSLWCCLLPGRFLAFCRNCTAPLVRQLPTRTKFRREQSRPRRGGGTMMRSRIFLFFLQYKVYLVFGNIWG